MLNYNKTYKVKPRYLEDYKKTGLYFISQDKAIFKNTLKYIRGNYKAFKVSIQGKNFIIQTKGQINILTLGLICYAVLFIIIVAILF